MDVKNAFLNGYIKEEVFVKQPHGFESKECPNHVHKLDNALYGLKHAPRAWYERLSKFLLDHGYKRGKIDNTLFLKEKGKYLLKMYRGMIGSLLYLTTSRPGIIFSVGICARFQANPKEIHLKVVKRILRYLKGTTDLCLSYPKDSNFYVVGYADADYVGFLVDRKSTSGMAHFLGSSLVSWATKKQNSVPLSATKTE
ncbi:secreted RxLR effector protein 161-like [Nicotiana tomentosiformis]|uniref:secreted RxLR effector protein 161-like n=1 Tax=Nicotiana tomentosiformis TaxID=4098 RepID=UPI00388CC233